MSRNDFGELLTPIHKKIFYEDYNEKPKMYSSTFSVDNMNMKEESFVHEGGFGLWGTNQEGADFNMDEMNEGQKVTFTAARFDKSYEVTWELMQDDQYNVFKGKGKGGSAQKLARGLAATEETETSKVITGGFSNTGYDGVSLFSKAHPLIDSDAKCSNLIEGALTDATLKEALTLMRAQKDEAGVLIAAHAKKLIVHPDWEFTARAILGSTLQAGTNFNDTNTVPNLELIVWDYLADNDAGLKPWYVQDNSFDNLKMLWREKPIFDSEKIDNKMDWRFYGYCRFDCGYVDWRGLVGSKGASDAGILTVTSVASTSTSGKTKITVSPAKTGSNTYKYKVGDTVTLPAAGAVLDNTYTEWNGTDEITAATGKKIVIAETGSDGKVVNAGVATVTAKA